MKDYVTDILDSLVKKGVKGITPTIRYAIKKKVVSDLLIASSDTFNTVVLDANNNLSYSPVDGNSIVVYKESTSTFYQRYTDWTCDPQAGTIKFLSTGSIVAGTNIVVDYKYYKAIGEMAAADILTALLTVDGAGSLLDGDKLDGVEGSGYALATHASRHTNGSDDIQNATAAQKGLATAAQITKLDSIDATRVVILKVMAEDTALATGDGKMYFTIPEELDGMNLVSVGAHVYTVSTSGLPTIQIYNLTDTVDMLTTRITIDENEKDSKTAATAADIDEAHDDVAEGDEIRIDVDIAGTGSKGLEIRLGFSL